jgi:hypothetical protein
MNSLPYLDCVFFILAAACRPDPRSMQWKANGELADGDLVELVVRLRAVEQPHHSQELLRLSSRSKSTN